MRILITGTAGFIGNALALRCLDAGHSVHGVDAVTDYYDVRLKRDRLARLAPHGRFTAHEIRLEDMAAMEAAFETAQPDVVVHLAAQAGVRHSLEHPRDYVDTNVIGSFNVTELCRRHAVGHFVLASTSSAYGANDSYPFRETDRAVFPTTIYAATKQASELIAHSHSHLYDVPTTCLRFFTIYGPWGRPDMALFKFTKAMFEGRAIDVYNHGQMQRDFTYIDDLVTGIAALINVPPIKGEPVEDDSLSPVAPYRLVNIGNSEPVALMEFIREIEVATDRSASLNMMEMQPGEVVKTYADAGLLYRLTGARPNTPIRAGVRAFVDWYRDYYRPG